MQVSLGSGNFMMVGRATKDAETRLSSNNKPFTTFSLAVGKAEDGSAKYANCIAFGREAKYAALIRKGTSVMAIGRIETNESGGKTYKNLVCESIHATDASLIVMDKRESEPPIAGSTHEFEESPASIDDDLPF